MEYQEPPEVIESYKIRVKMNFSKIINLLVVIQKILLLMSTQLIEIVIKHLEQELLLEGDGTLNLLEIATHGEDVLKD